DQASQDKPSTSGQATVPSEDHFSVRMDQLQNQLNQVLLMLHQNGSHDSGDTDHICTTPKLMHNIYKCQTPIIVNLPNGQTDQSRRIALDNLCDGLYFSTHHPMFLQPHPPFSTVSASLNFSTQDLVTHHTLS
nr:hypothetical protein [Tanacetum cinerariifolium]